MEENPRSPVLRTTRSSNYQVSGPTTDYQVFVNVSDGDEGNRRTGSHEVFDSDSSEESDHGTEPIQVPEEINLSDTEAALIPPLGQSRAQWESDEDNALNMDSVIIIEREGDIVQEPSVVPVPENPSAGVENPIIRLENPDYEPEEATDGEASRGSSKRSYGVMMAEDDDGLTCPVCLDVWTNAGAHRLCSLKCGHLFGKSCISRWLSLEKKKHCPQCNKKANLNDIRELYATKVIGLDATEKDRLVRELQEVKSEKKKLEFELMKSTMALENFKQQLDLLKAKLAASEGDGRVGPKAIVEKQEAGLPKVRHEMDKIPKLGKFHLEKVFVIEERACRVSAFSPLNNMVVISHQIRNNLFRGFAVKKIGQSGAERQIPGLIVHTKAIRDMCFHPVRPNHILTVSFDKTAKLSDLERNRIMKTFHSNFILWSCCWDLDDSDIFYTGSGNGVVSVYNVRGDTQPIASLNPVDDYGAVVALRYAPAGRFSKGAVICCRLNSVVFYEKVSPTEYNPVRLPGLLGPFFSLSYNSDTQHLLVSCRPSVTNPTVRHIYCEMNGTTVNKLFEFYGGTRQTLLCRSCFIPMGNESLCAVFQENTNTIELWSTSKFSRFQSIPVNDQILDLISITTEDRNFLGTLSDSVVRFFEGPK